MPPKKKGDIGKNVANLKSLDVTFTSAPTLRFINSLNSNLLIIVEHVTNRNGAGAVWACATQINQCTKFSDASNDDSDIQ